MKKIAIVGGGASGLVAAISAALKAKNVNKSDLIDISVIEQSNRVGRKILATGNGRCNITNEDCSIDNYHGNSLEFIEKVFSKFPVDKTMKFFNDLGLVLKNDGSGRVYPYSDQASTVVDILRMSAQELGVEEVCDFPVSNLSKKDGRFLLSDDKGRTIVADKVIVCCGGSASPKLGSDGSSYKLLTELGHETSKGGMFPSLVQIKTDTGLIKSLKGLRVSCDVSIKNNGNVLKKESGEVLFTEYGLSGIAILQLSRIVSGFFTDKKSSKLFVSIDFVPDLELEELQNFLIKRKIQLKDRTLEDFLNGILNKRVGQALLKYCDLKVSMPVGELNIGSIRKLAVAMKDCSIQCRGTMPFANAQVTAGGIATSDFNPETLESKVVEGLYAAGEILDVDGDCGGYNLQWAWTSGHLAGRSAALKCLADV